MVLSGSVGVLVKTFSDRYLKYNIYERAHILSIIRGLGVFGNRGRALFGSRETPRRNDGNADAQVRHTFSPEGLEAPRIVGKVVPTSLQEAAHPGYPSSQGAS